MSLRERWGLRLLGIALPVLLLVVAAPAAGAGQIVFQHGADIWVMNEDGSGAKPLLTVAQVPGMTSIGNPHVFPNGGADLAFEATTNANNAAIGSGPAGACGLQCTGIYTLAGGAVTRITSAPAPCGPTPQWCGSFSTNPDWTADGKIAYEYSQYTWEYSCIILPCNWTFTSALEEIHTTPPSPGGAGPTWAVQHGGIGSDLAPLTDPADAGKIAYIGASICSPECVYPLYISTGGGTDTPVVYDDNLIDAAWSPDGSTLADIEGGGERGIWTYAANDASTPGKSFVWALGDPIQNGSDPGNNPFDVSFSDVSWLGNGKVLFSAENNLWTIPASCGSGGTPCAFPQDATQLTTDGSQSAPDTSPAWTSAAQIEGVGGGQGQQSSGASASHGRLTGLAKGKAKLAFNLSGGAAGALSKIVVKPPKGLSFAKSRKRLAKGIVLRAGGKKLKFSAGLSHGTLVLSPKPPQTELQITIGPPATRVSEALALKARHHSVKKLTFTVTATGTSGKTTLQLQLKPQ